MSSLAYSFDLFRRQDAGTGAAPAADAEPAAGCVADEVTNDWAQLRIASIFVIMVGSLMGAVLPIWLARYRKSENSRLKKYGFFFAKYFGSGVIISTAFMHLISPANELLGMECLQPHLGTYDWSMAVVLITVMVMFFIELLASWFENKRDGQHSHSHSHGIEVMDSSAREQAAAKRRDLEGGAFQTAQTPKEGDTHDRANSNVDSIASSAGDPPASSAPHRANSVAYSLRNVDHLAHGRDHTEGDSHLAYGGKVTSIVILEAGVVLHSIFIGLTLAVTSGFVILFVVLVFHQTFEGLGLGSRLATFPWPADKRRWTPWVFAVLYGLTTPVAIAAGLGVKESLQNAPDTRFLVEGFCNAISGGILLYTGLVELMAHEFMFNPEMDHASLKYKLSAFGWMALGAGLMALLAKWA